MEYRKIVAVTGLPGLFEIISSKNDGAIVRSLEDGTTRFVAARTHNLSHLESIEIYTVRDNVPLSELFGAMKEKGFALPDIKDNKALRSYFEEVYPDLDFERVYASDMKKMVKWFDALQSKGIDFAEAHAEAQSDAEETKEAPVVEAPAAEPPAEEAAKPKRTRKKKEDKPE